MARTSMSPISARIPEEPLEYYTTLMQMVELENPMAKFSDGSMVRVIEMTTEEWEQHEDTVTSERGGRTIWRSHLNNEEVTVCFRQDHDQLCCIQLKAGNTRSIRYDTWESPETCGKFMIGIVEKFLPRGDSGE